ncbi:MAG: hypothetical protein WDO24_23990 [Pseudomonadota bacterium]
MLLHLENLAKSFSGVCAVDDVSFSIERHSITGLIGAERLGQEHPDRLPERFPAPRPRPGHVRRRRHHRPGAACDRARRADPHVPGGARV